MNYLCFEKWEKCSIKVRTIISPFCLFLACLYYFSHYCSSYPGFRVRERFGNITFSLQFFTRSLPCFIELHQLFYVGGIKIIPSDIFNLLTPVALVHWIMGDGSVSRHGLIICTHSFSILDVVLLINVLMIQYRLDYIICYPSGKPQIYIRYN